MNSQHDLGAETEPGSLERMLNNPQVSDGLIIQSIVQDYYEQAYQKALQRQPNPHLARQAACQALAQVVYQRQSYWGELSLEDSIHKSVQHFLNLQPKSCQGSPVNASIENTEGVSPLTAVEQALAELRRRGHRTSQVRMGLLSASGLAVAVLLLWLAGINQIVSITNPFNPVRFTYPYTTQPGDTLETIAEKAGVKVGDIHTSLGGTPTKPLSPGVILLLPSLKPSLWLRIFPRRAESPPSPLTLTSTPAEIKQRILDSPRYWQTLWAEQVTMDYGPPGYIAPPFLVRRQQIWIRQPDQGLMLIGGVRDPWLANAIYFDGNRVYQTDMVVPNIIYTNFSGGSNGQGSALSAQGLLFWPEFYTNEWQVMTVGTETVAGRDTLVVDLTNADGQRERRLWIDTHLGVILAQRWYAKGYNGTEHQAVLEDQIVLTIQFEVKIPEAMLDPNNHPAKFVKDVMGNPLEAPNLARPAALRFGPEPASIPKDQIPPPSGFDVNQSRLTLRLQPLPVDDLFNMESLGPNPESQIRKIDIFGDDYLLGTLKLDSTGWVNLNYCSRSPDGSLVLFDQLAAGRKVYWFRLSDPQNLHSLPDVQNSPGVYAFSPSSPQLAYYRCSLDLLWCGISLVNTETGEISRFIETPGQTVDWLGYSPDGGSLALILYPSYSPLPSPTPSLKIYDLDSAKDIYSGVFDMQTYKAAPDAPILAWGAAFQPYQNWPGGCDSP